MTGDVSYGGGERIMMMIMEEFKRRGHEIYVYSFFPEWESHRERFDRIRILRHQPLGLKKLKYLRELAAALREDQADALLCFPIYYAEVALFASRRAKVPFITSERCDPWLIPENRFHHLWRDFTFRMADGVVAQTGEVRKYFSRMAGNHTAVIPNPLIDSDLPAPAPEAGRHEIVAVGRLYDQKKFDLLIEAFRRLGPAHPYTLKIYGEGPLRGQLERQIKESGLEGRVLLMGKVNRVVDHISGAEIFVLSSEWEGMPNVLLEGMAMGLACISTDVRTGGARDLIKDGENGLLVPVGDVDALTKAMERLIQDPQLRHKLRSKAPAIRETHSKEALMPRWIEFVEQTIKRCKN